MNKCSWTQRSIVGRLIDCSLARSYRVRFTLPDVPKELKMVTLIIIIVIRIKHFLLKHKKYGKNYSFTCFLHSKLNIFNGNIVHYSKFLDTLRYMDGITEDVCSSGHTLSARAQAILSEVLLLIGSFILLGYRFHEYFTESHYSL